MGDMADWVNDDTPGPEPVCVSCGGSDVGADGEHVCPEPTGRDAFQAAIEELRRRVSTVHERVACPTCKQPAGERCVHIHRRSWVLAHAHSARLRADGIPDR